jgi:queuine/archaeosine tRNA-ribosyltransferase
MKEIRQAILDDSFETRYEEFKAQYYRSEV